MRTLVPLLVSVGVIACAGPEGGPSRAPAFSDPDVERIHASLRHALDPDDRWSQLRYLAFDWVYQPSTGEPIRRAHRWDRWEGTYRLETESAGKLLLALFDTDAPGDGRVWLDGAPLAGDTARALLARANAMYVNDSYWLIMPYKWTDPGVHLRYLGTSQDAESRDLETVEISFDEVGLTPQNQYHAMLDRETGRMVAWEHYRTRDAPPSPATWTDWQTFSGVSLALKRDLGEGARLYFENVEVSEVIPPGAFDPPGALR